MSNIDRAAAALVETIRPRLKEAADELHAAARDLFKAALDPEAEADREPPADDFHSSIGLWQQQPATWEEA